MATEDRRFIEGCEEVLQQIYNLECDIQNFHMYLPEDGISRRVEAILKYALNSLQAAKKRVKNAMRMNSLRHQRIIIFDPVKNEARYANGTEAEKLIVAIDEKRTPLNVL